MVSSEHRTGLYVSVPVYFSILLFSAIWAYRRMEKMTSSGQADALAGHYLGGRAFGPVLTAGTVFASLFSGYTVVGIPNEAYATGFLSFRWMSATAMLLLGYIGTGTRLRKASMVRNHQTPVDFITDRFQSQYLRYMIVTCQVLGSLIYLAAQVNALKQTFNGIFLGEHDQDSNVPVILLMLLILLFEWMGGLSSVALTDSIQGLVMMLSFILLPFVIKKHYGGFSDLDPATYPRPDFYSTPTKDEQWSQWQFSMLMFGFFTLPHLMIRIYSARDLGSLRTAWSFLTISPWAAMFVSIFLGIMGVEILSETEPTTSSAFTAILEQLMDLGGLSKAVGVIAFTASLAAIMSTADSLIIAVSQLITVEIVYPLRPEATPSAVAWWGRVVSLFTTGFSLIIGILWKDGISDLGKINFAVTMQAVPAFLIGLYLSAEQWEPHPWSIATACGCSQVYVFFIYFTYIKVDNEPLPIDAGITGVTLNCVLILLLEALYRCMIKSQRGSSRKVAVSFSSDQQQQQDTRMTMSNARASKSISISNKTNKNRVLMMPDRPAWDVPKLGRFGERTLTPHLLNKMMAGTWEPFRNVFYVLLMFLSVSFVTPLVAQDESSSDVATFNGLPWWFFKQILLCIIPYVILLITVLRTPSEFPCNEREIQKHGVDLDAIEMTPKELNRRSCYDESNELYHRRRSTIKSQMVELGLTVPESSGDEVDEKEEAHDNQPNEAELRFSALVLGKNNELSDQVVVEEDVSIVEQT